MQQQDQDLDRKWTDGGRYQLRSSEQIARRVGRTAGARGAPLGASRPDGQAPRAEDVGQGLVTCPISGREEEYRIRISGRVVQLARTMGPNEKASRRGIVQGFSAKSRARMVKALESVAWDSLGPLLFVGLTYPGDYPRNGLVVKDQLDRFKRRWRRAFGDVAGAWKFEFQVTRPAPHLHLLLQWPSEGGQQIPIEDLRAWVAMHWSQVVASRDQVKHRQVGTSVGRWKSDRSPARYFAKYGLKPDKADQNAVPAGFVSPGRFWGLWGIRPEWHELKIPREVWIKANRTLRKIQIRRGSLKAFCRSGEQGRWVAGGMHSGDLADLVLKQVEAELVGLHAGRAADRDTAAAGPGPGTRREVGARGAAADGSGS